MSPERAIPDTLTAFPYKKAHQVGNLLPDFWNDFFIIIFRLCLFGGSNLKGLTCFYAQPCLGGTTPPEIVPLLRDPWANRLKVRPAPCGALSNFQNILPFCPQSRLSGATTSVSQPGDLRAPLSPSRPQRSGPCGPLREGRHFPSARPPRPRPRRPPAHPIT